MLNLTTESLNCIDESNDGISIFLRQVVELLRGPVSVGLIAEVCEAHNVHTPTFLAIVNKLVDINNLE